MAFSLKRKASPKSTTEPKLSKQLLEEQDARQHVHDAQDWEPGLTGDSLCDGCLTIDFEELFKRGTKARGGFWGPNVGNPALDSKCPLCNFFAVMSPQIRSPLDEKSDFEFRKWQNTGKDHFLVAFSPSQIFGIPDRKTPGRHSKNLIGSFLTVLPAWIWNTDHKKHHHQFWEHAQIDPGFIALQDGSSEPEGFSGRTVSPSMVDVDLILAWMRYCDEQHKKHCAPAPDSAFKSLKVIDCETRDIIYANQDRPYVALSYVWGSDTSPTTSAEPGHLPETCSKVIEDAIQIVKRLSHRYLWVDKYCIDQNDANDKHHQIANMDSIYAGAYLTIVAAAGTCASYGLPGVGSTHRIVQPRILVRNHLLVSTLPNPAKTIANSKWMSRAWTYQEGLLSKRRLVFTEHQVYFQCLGMHCFESINLPLNYLHTRSGIHAKNSRFYHGTSFARVFPSVSVARRADDYLSRVQEYVQRVLSYDSDALNAILGVLKVFATLPVPIYHHCGIPLFSLKTVDSRIEDWHSSYIVGLTWEFETVAERRHGLPSWSWVGWKKWTKMNFPLVVFGTYTVGFREETSQGYASAYTDKAYFDVESEFGKASGPLIENGHPNFEALSTNSPFLYITTWTVELHLRRSQNFRWEILNPELTRYTTGQVSMNVVKEANDGEYRWKACLLGRQGGTELMQEVRWTPIFLLVGESGDCFERVGTCIFTRQTNLTKFAIGKEHAFIGNLQMRKERIKLG